MGDQQLDHLRTLATAFRDAIEAARAQRLPGALPYFPEGACRMTSRLLAQHLACRPDPGAFGRVQFASGILPSVDTPARHHWLVVDGAVVDLTADAFGQDRVIVGARSAFHESLMERDAVNAATVLASMNADETARLGRQLAAIEACMAALALPAV